MSKFHGRYCILVGSAELDVRFESPSLRIGLFFRALSHLEFNVSGELIHDSTRAVILRVICISGCNASENARRTGLRAIRF